ncbi:MAG TPA: hypothetical protein VK174_01335 [Chitinophagales bacterium]|nr:hypothetical protein [Chitinophagales bacterium]
MSVFTRENLLYFVKEALWMAITALLITAVLYPITSKLDFIYWKMNSFFIFIAITYFRWSVTFRSLPFLRPAAIRFILFAGNLSLFIYIMYNLQKFIGLADNFYIEDFGFPKVIIFEDVKREMFDYLYKELVFFGTAALVMLSAFQVRLIISYWQYYKHASSRMLED